MSLKVKLPNRCLLAVVLFLLLTSCTHMKMGLFMFNSNPSENEPSAIVRGQEVFKAQCSRCHGENADGTGPDAKGLATAPTNFRDPAFTKSATRIAAHITYGKGSLMPAFGEDLSYETIWALANYLRSLQPVP